MMVYDIWVSIENQIIMVNKIGCGWWVKISDENFQGVIKDYLVEGILVLIKEILEAIMVFQHTMAHIPKGILEKI